LHGVGNAGLEAEISPRANICSLELYLGLDAFAIDINRAFARGKLSQDSRNPKSHAVKIRWPGISRCKSVGYGDIGIIRCKEQTERLLEP
jgi:hypothetical protein